MLWILLPAFNEEDSLHVLLPKIADKVAERGLQYKMVVVEDGSSDRTRAVLEEYRGQLPLEIVMHPINRGLGEAERDGFEYIAERCAADDIIIRMDCDDTHEPEYMFHLTDKMREGFDVVNTSRFQPGGGQIGVNVYRAIISRAANVFMKIVFPIPGTRDYSCGYRAYRGRVIQDAIRVYGDNFIQLRGLGFTSTLEMIVKLRLLGCRFAEVPFVLRYDQKSSASKMVSSVTTLGYLVMAVLYHWPFGGWRRSYRGLAKLYQTDCEQAVASFSNGNLRLPSASRISF